MAMMGMMAMMMMEHESWRGLWIVPSKEVWAIETALLSTMGPQPSHPPRRVRFSTTPCWSGRGYVLVAQVDPWVADPARHSVYRPRSRPVLGSIERGDQVRPGMVDPWTADPC